MCPVRQRTQTVGKFFPVRDPFTDGLLPACIKNEQFASGFRRELHLFPYVFFIHFRA